MGLPTAILLEVMDKEWPIWLVLVVFIGLGLAGMLVCRKKPSLAVLFLTLVLWGGIRQLMELNDPYVGPAMRNEAGTAYVVLSYISIGVGILLPLIGAWHGHVSRKSRSNPISP